MSVRYVLPSLNNPAMHFNHNWRDRWCYCDKEERLPMVQCVQCCDWFHEDCAKERYLLTHGEVINLEDEKKDFYCEACESKIGSQVQPMQTQLVGQPLQSPPMVQPSQLPQQESQRDKEEEVDDNEEKKMERKIRSRLKKNDKAGAMKLVREKKRSHF